jgi:hypothetical protein
MSDQETPVEPGCYRLEDIQRKNPMTRVELMKRGEDIRRKVEEQYHEDIRREVENQVREEIKREQASAQQLIEQIRLEKDAMMWKMHQEKEAMMQKMQLEKETMMKKMQRDIYELEKAIKRKAEEDAARVEMEKHIQMEKTKDFLAKEKHWSSDIDSLARFSPSVRSIISAFLKTIPNETTYAIHSISVKNYGRQDHHGNMIIGQSFSEKVYIATQSKIYRLNMGGDIYGNYRIGPDSIFEKIVTFPSEPTPTFWRAVFSQMGHEDIKLTVNGDEIVYRLANEKLETLFRSFR